MNVDAIDDFRYIEKWDNSEEAYLFRPNFKESDKLEESRAVDRWRVHDKNKKISYIIESDGKVIGKVGYTLDFPHLYKNAEKTAWIDIVIGERDARGKGIGAKALDFIESKIKEAGIDHIELGVFEFNERAYNLYKKQGYKEIARVEKITYYKGSWRRDIRMEKEL